MGTTPFGGDGLLTKSQALYAKFNLPHHPATAALSVYHLHTHTHKHTHTHARKTGTRRFRAVIPDKQTINLLGEKDAASYNACVLYYGEAAYV